MDCEATGRAGGEQAVATLGDTGESLQLAGRELVAHGCWLMAIGWQQPAANDRLLTTRPQPSPLGETRMLPSRLATTLSATVLLAALASSAPAQGATPVDLGKRVARSKYQLGRVFAVQELPDGRVVASDTKEAAFRLIDLATGGDALLGKQGD